MTKAEYLQKWSQLHGDMQAADNRVVYWWLSIVYVLAKPWVRLGLSPNAVTTFGLLLSVAAVALIWLGQEISGINTLVLLAAVLVLLSGLVDNLDGAVAVMTGKTSRWGYVYDSLCDRIADMAFLFMLWLLGAPAWLVLLVAMFTMLAEYVRARAAAAGVSEIGVISVWERPSRVLVTGLFVLASAVIVGHVGVVITIAATLSLLLSVLGFLQIVLVMRRRLLALPETAG